MTPAAGCSCRSHSFCHACSTWKLLCDFIPNGELSYGPPQEIWIRMCQLASHRRCWLLKFYFFTLSFHRIESLNICIEH
jgi:hypothetical protein